MIKRWLVLDVHYLCHRAFHTSKHLSWNGVSTGVIFGFLKSILALKDEFQTDRVAFCFEHPVSYRKKIFPEYKQKRRKREWTEEERQSFHAFEIQISELQRKYLPKIGFKNVFSFRGMESDDIMARIAENLKDDEEAILVTSDHDLYQCLRSGMVTIYCPQTQRMLTEEWFVSHYRIQPKKWALVKAIAGCRTDEVPGVAGIGEATVLKFLRGELPANSKAFQKILSPQGKEIVRRNRPLVELPFKGCLAPKLVKDSISKRDWLRVCDLLGMRSLASRPPIATRRLNEGFQRQ